MQKYRKNFKKNFDESPPHRSGGFFKEYFIFYPSWHLFIFIFKIKKEEGNLPKVVYFKILEGLPYKKMIFKNILNLFWYSFAKISYFLKTNLDEHCLKDQPTNNGGYFLKNVSKEIIPKIVFKDI